MAVKVKAGTPGAWKLVLPLEVVRGLGSGRQGQG